MANKLQGYQVLTVLKSYLEKESDDQQYPSINPTHNNPTQPIPAGLTSEAQAYITHCGSYPAAGARDDHDEARVKKRTHVIIQHSIRTAIQIQPSQPEWHGGSKQKNFFFLGLAFAPAACLLQFEVATYLFTDTATPAQAYIPTINMRQKYPGLPPCS